MVNGMSHARIAIDKAGRLLLPKALRDRFRLRPGSQLKVEVRDDHLELRPLEQGPALAKEDGWWIYQGAADSVEDLESAVREHRSDRLARLAR